MLKKALTFVAAIYILFCLALFAFQRRLLYYPDKTPFENCTVGEKISTSNYRSILYSGNNPQSILFFHGNAGDACERTGIYKNLQSLDANLFLFEYPGFAEDTDVSQEKILRSVDAWIADYQTKKKANEELFIMGESLGTGVATYASTKIANQGLVLFSPYTSIAEVGQFHYPIFPVSFLIIDQFLAKEWASQTLSPRVLAFHGKLDTVIPIDFGKRQMQNFKIPTNFIAFPDKGHNDLTVDNEELWNRTRSTFKGI